MFCTVFFSYLLVVSLQIKIRILTYLHLHTHSLSQEDAYSNKDSILRLLESLKFPDHLPWLLSVSATMPLGVSFPNLNWVSPSLTVAVKLACPVLTTSVWLSWRWTGLGRHRPNKNFTDYHCSHLHWSNFQE